MDAKNIVKAYLEQWNHVKTPEDAVALYTEDIVFMVDGKVPIRNKTELLKHFHEHFHHIRGKFEVISEEILDAGGYVIARQEERIGSKQFSFLFVIKKSDPKRIYWEAVHAHA